MYNWLIKLMDKFQVLSLCCVDMNENEEEYINLLKKRISDLIKEFNDCVNHQQTLQRELDRVRTLIETSIKKQMVKTM